MELAAKKLPPDFEYDVVKLNLQTNAVSFIRCMDFDSVEEPTVGDSLIVNSDGSVRSRGQPADPEIYHHKWLFVADDYAGFDVGESKRRSLSWLALDKIDAKRIGRKSYWKENVVPRIRDVSD